VTGAAAEHAPQPQNDERRDESEKDDVEELESAAHDNPA
jgi:hypothetical protein